MSEITSLDRAATVSLRQITKETVRTIIGLDVAPHQKAFVASNAVSIAQAHFEERSWFRAIYANETPVGFLMLYEDPGSSEYFLWRFMVDARYQGLGFGRQAIELVYSHVKSLPGATQLLVSHAEGNGNPGGFYLKLGFNYTGAVEHGERVMRRPL